MTASEIVCRDLLVQDRETLYECGWQEMFDKVSGLTEMQYGVEPHTSLSFRRSADETNDEHFAP